MKRLKIFFLVFLLIFSFTACQSKSTDSNSKVIVEENEKLEGSLGSILEKIYETAEVSDNFNRFIETGLQIVEITRDNSEYFLGKKDIKFESGIASEPIMPSSTYSLCLIRVKKGADIDQVKKDIKENVDPMKWVSEGVNPENIIVDNIGDVVILIMSDDEAKNLHEGFLSLKG